MTTTSNACTKEMLRRGIAILERLETYVDAPVTLSVDCSQPADPDSEVRTLWMWFLQQGSKTAVDASTSITVVVSELTRLERLMDDMDEMHSMAAEQRRRARAERDENRESR